MKELIRFDWAIKRILRNKANFSVLEGFLSVLLKEDIKIKQLLESESNQEDAVDKYNKVDILVENDKGELILIEIQNSSELDYFHRMSYGVSKLTTESLNLGNPYSEIKKVISINIVYFDLGQGEDYVYWGKTKFKGIHTSDYLQLSDKQKSLFEKEEVYQLFPEFYILKINKFNDKAKDSLDEWIYFLKNSKIEQSFTAKGLQEASEILDVMKLDEAERKRYKYYLENQTYQASLAQTISYEQQLQQQELAKETKKAIATAMKKAGEPVEKIQQYTGLSVEEIEGF